MLNSPLVSKISPLLAASPLLLAVNVLVMLLNWVGSAKATEAIVGLSFELPPVEASAQNSVQDSIQGIDAIATDPSEHNSQDSQEYSQPKSEKQPTSVEDESLSKLVRPQEPLPPLIESPVLNTSIETSTDKSTETPTETSTERSLDKTLVTPNTMADIGIQFQQDSIKLLPPMEEAPSAELPTDLNLLKNPTEPIAITFSATNVSEASSIEPSSPNTSPTEPTMTALADDFRIDDWIFEGGSDSLVAHTVGSAEGTRQANGERTNAYYGHQDPGNGVWNLGTFSYQHGASSPEEADEKQIKRLKYQGLQLEEQAAQQGVKLSLIEKLNGLDLANQAPLAALGRGGYIERLAQAHRLGLRDEEAISWARTRAYLDPDTRMWNAPGLGNNLHSISRDQDRRITAIDQAMRAYSLNGEQSLSMANLQNISLQEPHVQEASLDNIGIEFELSESDMAHFATVPTDDIAVAAQPTTLEADDVATEAMTPNEVIIETETIETETTATATTDEKAVEIEDAADATMEAARVELDAIAPIAPARAPSLTNPLNAPPVDTDAIHKEASAEPNVDARQSEIALPAPLKTTNDPTDTHTPNRSWWHNDDKIARRK